MKFLEKIQNLPQKTRKIILWAVVIVLGATFLVIWVKSFKERLSGFQGDELIEQLDLPEVELPKMPELPENEIQKIKESLESLETNAE